MQVGILALQGGFAAHAQALTALNISWRLIKKPVQLQSIDMLIIPGGESTTLLKLMQPWSFMQALKDFHQQQKLIFGTCAGAILLAKKVDPQQPSLGLIDIDITRNAYGSQINSFVASADQTQLNTPLPAMLFIRAPKITRTGQQVQILAKHNNDPVLVQENNIMVATFHPELNQQLGPIFQQLSSQNTFS